MCACRFSLIIATVERTSAVERLLASLSAQTFLDFEVIVVDQNDDGRLEGILRAWSDQMTLKHLRSARGLSRARNAGLRAACGEIIAFPDDDCWYPPDLLRELDRWFRQHDEYSFLSTCAITGDGNRTAGRWLARSTEIRRGNVFRTHVSFSLFFRVNAVRVAGGFDEALGLGSDTPHGSAEETDYVLRLLEHGSRGWYESALTVFHPAPSPTDSLERETSRAYSYGMGFGYVLRRHRMPFVLSLYLCIRPAGGWLWNITHDRRSSAISLATLRGRLLGYFRSQES